MKGIQPRTEEKIVQRLAKDFFGFGRTHTPITIVLPSFEKKRKSTLECANYPLYKYEVSPDDVISSLRIYCLLSQTFPGRVIMNFAKEFKLAPDHHTVLVGGPPTNRFVGDATRNCPIRFSTPDNRDRHLIGPAGKTYRIKFNDEAADENNKSIVEDYCLISKRTFGTRTEFVIAGLRAYGQVEAYKFLGDAEFYRKAGRVAGPGGFQVVVRVFVNESAPISWEIVEVLRMEADGTPRYAFDAFISHSQRDAFRARELARKLSRYGITVWLDEEQIAGGDDIIEKVQDGLRNSKYVVPCLSRNLINSKWCRAEYGYLLNREFTERNTLVIPVKIGEVADEDIPPLLAGKKWIDVRRAVGVEELAMRLKS